jgi:hypothetical protein
MAIDDLIHGLMILKWYDTRIDWTWIKPGLHIIVRENVSSRGSETLIANNWHKTDEGWAYGQ